MIDQDAIDAAAFDRGYMTEHRRIQATGKTNCDACPHPRRSHSRNGCTETGCPCTVTYMDLRAPELATVGQ